MYVIIIVSSTSNNLFILISHSQIRNASGGRGGRRKQE